MDTGKLIETQNLPEEAQSTDGGHSLETVKLVVMGDVLSETKGFFRGLEIGFTPRS
jgi:hypothetical protein